VLLDRDPLADIHNTTSIRAVILGGRFMLGASLDAMLAEAEATAAKPPTNPPGIYNQLTERATISRPELHQFTVDWRNIAVTLIILSGPPQGAGRSMSANAWLTRLTLPPSVYQKKTA
jgi:hypothetical protein